jgi:hypothetical protein
MYRTRKRGILIAFKSRGLIVNLQLLSCVCITFYMYTVCSTIKVTLNILNEWPCLQFGFFIMHKEHKITFIFDKSEFLKKNILRMCNKIFIFFNRTLHFWVQIWIRWILSSNFSLKSFALSSKLTDWEWVKFLFYNICIYRIFQ